MIEYIPSRFSEGNGCVIILDDDKRSVETHIDIVRERGFDVYYLTDISDIEETISSHGKRSLFVSDMRIPGIRDLSKVNLPMVSTNNGDAVGLAIISNLLPMLNVHPFASCVLTGYPLSPYSLEHIERCKNDGIEISVFDKHMDEENLTKFVDFVEYGRASLSEERMKENNDRLIAANRIATEWSFGDYKAVAAIFGYVGETAEEWERTYSRVLANDACQDIRDRVELILEIKAGISSLISYKDIETQGEWLREADDLLSGASPWEIMTSGHQHQLAKVAAFVARIVR